LAQSKGGKIVSKENKFLTTAFGIPVADNQNTMTAGERGPVLLHGA
jgi:catalase